MFMRLVSVTQPRLSEASERILADLPLVMIETAFRKPKLPKSMTIVIAIVAKTNEDNDTIVVASDGQNTDGTFKKFDAKKISVIPFKNSRILLAESGSSKLSGRAVEIFEHKAEGKSITDYETVSLLAQESVREVRQTMLGGFAPGQITSEDFQRYIQNNWRFELLLAHYWKDTPRIVTIDNVSQVANKVQGHFAAVGCGADLANYLLGQHCRPNQSLSFAIATAIYVVEQVKQHIDGCSGDTQIGMVFHYSEELRRLRTKGHPETMGSENSIMLPSSTVNLHVAELAKVNDEAQIARVHATDQMLKRIAKMQWNDLKAEVKKRFGVELPD